MLGFVAHLKKSKRKNKKEHCVYHSGYLACNPDKEVDHCVCMLFFHRLSKHGLCTWHGLATAKHLNTQTNILILYKTFCFSGLDTKKTSE